ncbi:hypothetical protein H5410_046296 [Solanum commersonii]|uniref:Uncharacterized protein n=1 Tax=Solanum commersonii TaxID=4109 RepID=A0A9J5XF95_SOLCO|nr:hypothetical protein H5410_046296 [Solanum commersonii]
MHLNRCHERVNFEFELATLMTMVGNKRGDTSYEMIQLEFEIATLEAHMRKEGVVVDIDDILGICNKSQ